MRWLRFLVLPFVSVLIIAAAIAAHCYYIGFHHGGADRSVRKTHADASELLKLREKACVLKKFACQKKYNQRIILLADMGLPSGKYRFFVYDTEKDSVIKSGLIAHGHSNHGFSYNPEFSNSVGSSCTALGKYKIGKTYQGNFGIAYRLYGLDSSNNNAFLRNIVLHSHYCVPHTETYPYPICNSSGCAMVSPEYFSEIRQAIDTCSRPVLLWIFN